MSTDSAKQATLYRMVMEKHLCPFGLKSLDLLEREGYTIEDNWLTSREQTDAFKEKHHVDTTPQTFINGERIGGYDDLRRHFGKKVKAKNETSYQPVMAVFGVAALLALAISWMMSGSYSLSGVWNCLSPSACASSHCSNYKMLKASRPCFSITTCWPEKWCVTLMCIPLVNYWRVC